MKTNVVKGETNDKDDVVMKHKIVNDIKNKNDKIGKNKKNENKNNNIDETSTTNDLVVKSDNNESEGDENALEIDITDDENAKPNENVVNKVGVKRVNTDAEIKTPSLKKKMRQKSKPQVIENMKDYVGNNTIDKLTITTLLHWLKERSIYCTTRDKKADLIVKVKNYFLSQDN